MKNKQESPYYISKGRIVFLLVMSLAFIAFGVLITAAGFSEGDLLLSGLGAFILLLFFVFFILGLKKLFNTKPYLILTEDELIIDASSKRALHIEWEDIEGYRIYKQNYNKFIGVILYDEDKYFNQMSDKMRRLYKINTKLGLPLFNVVWGQVKRKDRDRLLDELDWRAFEDGSREKEKIK